MKKETFIINRSFLSFGDVKKPVFTSLKLNTSTFGFLRSKWIALPSTNRFGKIIGNSKHFYGKYLRSVSHHIEKRLGENHIQKTK